MGNISGRLSFTYSALKLFWLHNILNKASTCFIWDSKSSQTVRPLVSETDIVVTAVFPPEIIFEILSWLPVKCLGRVTVVCKQWYALVKDRQFIEKSMSRGPSDVIFNIIPTSNVNANSEYNYKHVSTCDGLRLEKNRTTQKYVVRNKATKHFLELPDPHNGSHRIFFSYVPSTSNYKFVSIYDDENSIECCEVLSLEDDEFLWRPLEIPTIEALNQNMKKIYVVSTGDAVHCVRVIAIGATIVEQVISLDLGSEKFTVTNFPSGHYKSWEMVWPINFNGILSIVDRMGDDLCVLVLEDYKSQKWGERKTLIPLASMKRLEGKYGTVSPQAFDQSGILWFRVQDKMFISYDMKSGRVLSNIKDREDRKVKDIFDCTQFSLVSLKGMQPEPKTLKQPSSNQV